ncbi:MAG: MmcQ/YjbR family DNA-binding protein [Planctomycetota bacterium]
MRTQALGYPETYEETPWGERVVKVRKKVFVFVGEHDGGLSFTAKLPVSGAMALQLPFATPTGYGLGKSGWVTARFPKGEDVPVELLEEWLDESYRAVAPKKLSKLLDAPGGAPTEAKAQPARRRRGRGLVLSGDPLRAERAQRSYAAQGLSCDVGDLVVPQGRRKLALVVVDLGRRPGEALELAAELGARDKAPLLVCGIRDARMEKRAVAALGDVPRCRHAPGSPDAVAQGLALLDG